MEVCKHVYAILYLLCLFVGTCDAYSCSSDGVADVSACFTLTKHVKMKMKARHFPGISPSDEFAIASNINNRFLSVAEDLEPIDVTDAACIFTN